MPQFKENLNYSKSIALYYNFKNRVLVLDFRVAYSQKSTMRGIRQTSERQAGPRSK